MVPVLRLYVHDIDVARYRPDDPRPEIRIPGEPAPLVPAPERGDQRNVGLLAYRTHLVEQISVHQIEPYLDERRAVLHHFIDSSDILHGDDDLHAYRMYSGITICRHFPTAP